VASVWSSRGLNGLSLEGALRLHTLMQMPFSFYNYLYDSVAYLMLKMYYGSYLHDIYLIHNLVIFSANWPILNNVTGFPVGVGSISYLINTTVFCIVFNFVWTFRV